MGSIRNPETSALNQLTPRDNPENGKIQFHSGESLRSRNCRYVKAVSTLHKIWKFFLTA
jgi:hypothetical protein